MLLTINNEVIWRLKWPGHVIIHASANVKLASPRLNEQYTHQSRACNSRNYRRVIHYRPRICRANLRFMCVSGALYEMRINVFRKSWIFISSPLTRFNDKIRVSSFSQSNCFVTTQWYLNHQNWVDLAQCLHCYCLTSLWIFLIRLVLQISIPVSI